MNAFSHTITVSDDMEVLIPREVSESLRLKPGQKLRALDLGGTIRLVPIMTLDEAQGFLKGIDTTLEREPDREF